MDMNTNTQSKEKIRLGPEQEKTECCNDCYDLFYVKAQEQEELYLIESMKKKKEEKEYDEFIKELNKKPISKLTKLSPNYRGKKKCGKAYCRHPLADHNVKIPYKNYWGKSKCDWGCSKCECDKMKNTKTKYGLRWYSNKIRKGMESITAELCNHSEVLFVWERVWHGRDYRLGDISVDLPFVAYVTHPITPTWLKHNKKQYLAKQPSLFQIEYLFENALGITKK